VLYWRCEPQDIALELRSAAMPAVGPEDIHQFPYLKSAPALEDMQDRRFDPEVQIKIEVSQMPVFGQPNPHVLIQVGLHLISPC
jgi:hypothetical protein